MATKKKASVAKRSKSPAQPKGEERSENPLDWLFDNPLGSFPNFGFGILKQSYKGHPNSVLEFGLKKLSPIKASEVPRSEFEGWTAHRFGAVLPYEAPDEWDDVLVLLRALEAAVLSHQPAILLYLTLAFPDAQRHHACWEEARAFALAVLAHKRQLPTILVQHAPGKMGSANPPHIHLLVSPRRLTGLGWGAYADDLLVDEGQRALHAEWLAFRGEWASRSIATD